MAENKERVSKQKNQTSARSKPTSGSSSSQNTRSRTGNDKSTRSRVGVREMMDEERRQRKQSWAVALFAIAVLVFCVVVIPGESVWNGIHKVMIGFFGWAGAIIVPIGIAYVAVVCALDRPSMKVGAAVAQSIGIVVFVTAIIYAFICDSYSGSFIEILSDLYKWAPDTFNSGILGGIIGIPAIALAGKTGARIILILILFVLIMLATKTGLISLFKMIWKPFKMSAKLVKAGEEKQTAKKNAETNVVPIGVDMPAKREKQSKKSAKDIDIPMDDDEFVPPPDDYYKKKKRSVQQNRTNQNTQRPTRAFFDIPLDNEPQESDYENAMGAGKLSDIPITSHFDNVDMQTDASLDKLVKSAENLQREGEADNVPEEAAVAEQQPLPTETKPVLNSEQTREILQLINKVKDDQIKNTQKKPMLDDDISSDQAKLEYKRPPISMYNSVTGASQEDIQTELKQNAEKLVDTLRSFGIETRIVGISRGPSVTRYELQPAAGVKISRITNLADDIALGLAAISVRIEAPIPGRSAIGVEIPNHVRSTVSLREVLESPEFRKAKSKITVALGRDITGKVVVTDLAKMPHLLIAGTTGSGKSVTVQCMIQSVLYNSTPDEVKILLIDPKRVEFKAYNGIPNLLVPVVTEPRKAAGALGWAVTEMLKRYNTFADLNVRDIYDYNELAAQDDELDHMPQILIIVDEFSDLMMTAKNEVEDYVCRLAQMARAAGMHLVIATQRPSTDVITGLIKANIPSRLALSVSNNTDSRVILDSGGAEKLLGNGDMLFNPIGESKPLRIQGCFVSIKEITAVTDFLRNQNKESYDESVMDEIEKQSIPDNTLTDNSDEAQDELLPQAIEIVIDVGEASATLLQRRLRLGYARAGRLVDTMERMGIVGPHEGSKPRKVLLSRQDWLQMKMNNAE